MDKQAKPTILVDLDGTLAKYKGWHGHTHIGEPIPTMKKRIQRWLREGKLVKIFTARMAEKDPEKRKEIVDAIQAWTEKHFDRKLSVTNEKDSSVVRIWDDRAMSVARNQGRQTKLEFHDKHAAITPEQEEALGYGGSAALGALAGGSVAGLGGAALGSLVGLAGLYGYRRTAGKQPGGDPVVDKTKKLTSAFTQWLQQRKQYLHARSGEVPMTTVGRAVRGPITEMALRGVYTIPAAQEAARLAKARWLGTTLEKARGLPAATAVSGMGVPKGVWGKAKWGGGKVLKYLPEALMVQGYYKGLKDPQAYEAEQEGESVLGATGHNLADAGGWDFSSGPARYGASVRAATDMPQAAAPASVSGRVANVNSLEELRRLQATTGTRGLKPVMEGYGRYFGRQLGNWTGTNKADTATLAQKLRALAWAGDEGKPGAWARRLEQRSGDFSGAWDEFAQPVFQPQQEVAEAAE